MADKKNINYKMLTLIIVLVVIITGVASFTFFTYFSAAENSEEKEEFKLENIKSTYAVGNFVVNIANNGSINFVRASLVFEIENNDLIKELEKRKSQLRDKIIITLRSQNETILKEPNAKTIKKIIKDEVNKILKTGEITNVWFTELVVQ